MSVFTNPSSGSVEHARAYTAAVLDLVGGRDPMEVLERTPAALREAAEGLSEAELRRPEAPGKWAVNQVLQHLADSELVWGWRLRLVLAHDRPPLSGYDQDAWAARLGYEEAEAEQALEDFSVLRRANLRLLRRTGPAERARVAVHAERGEESVEHMMRLYAGHDLLHLRQMERIRAAVAGTR
jgi:uncharacterized damage-inducible protein DinB